MLRVEEQLSKQLNRVYEEEREKALAEVDALWRKKAADYDSERGVMERSPLGEGSFMHELVKKIGRLEASWRREGGPQVEDLEDQLRDIANYAVGFIAYKRAVARLADVELTLTRPTGGSTP